MSLYLKGSQIEVFRFEGAKAANGTVDSAAVVDVSSSFPDIQRQGLGVVDITDTAHGYIAGDSVELANHVYLRGTANYNGIHRIHSVPDANSLYIVANFTAESLSTSDTIGPGMSFPEQWLFRGYKLHLAAAATTSENFVISVDAAAGSNFDYNIVTSNMNNVQDLGRFFMDDPVPINKNDVVYVTWANTNTKAWGLELWAQRLR